MSLLLLLTGARVATTSTGGNARRLREEAIKAEAYRRDRERQLQEDEEETVAIVVAALRSTLRI